MVIKAVAVIAMGLVHVAAAANTGDARTLLANSSDQSLQRDSALVSKVAGQLETIRAACAASSSGAPPYDKLAFTYSKLDKPGSLPQFISDVEIIARRHCSKHPDSMLMGVYMFERNEGKGRAAVVSQMLANPDKLIRKWSSR